MDYLFAFALSLFLLSPCFSVLCFHQPTNNVHTIRTCVSGACNSNNLCATVTSVAGVCVPLRAAEQANSVAWAISCGTNGAIRTGLYTDRTCAADSLVTFEEHTIPTCHTYSPTLDTIAYTCATNLPANPFTVGDPLTTYTQNTFYSGSGCSGNVVLRYGIVSTFCSHSGDAYSRLSCTINPTTNTGRLSITNFDSYDRQCSNPMGVPTPLNLPLCASNVAINCMQAGTPPPAANQISWVENTGTTW